MSKYNDYRGAYQGIQNVNRYEKEIYSKDGFDNSLWEIEKTALLSILEKVYSSLENTETLDFACGTGRITEFLESYMRNIDALDISEEMVSVAKTKTKNVNYIVGDIINDPEVNNKKYDLITTFRFVLFAEPELREAVFRKLALMLHDDHGRIIVGLHGNPYSRRGLVHIFQKLKATPQEDQLRSFSLNEMRSLAANAGLEVVDYTGVGFVPRKIFDLFGSGFYNLVEKILYRAGFLKYFGSNLIVVCKLKHS